MLGFSMVQKAVKAWSCCCTPANELANFWLLITATVRRIQASNSAARTS